MKQHSIYEQIEKREEKKNNNNNWRLCAQFLMYICIYLDNLERVVHYIVNNFPSFSIIKLRLLRKIQFVTHKKSSRFIHMHKLRHFSIKLFCPELLSTLIFFFFLLRIKWVVSLFITITRIQSKMMLFFFLCVWVWVYFGCFSCLLLFLNKLL